MILGYDTIWEVSSLVYLHSCFLAYIATWEIQLSCIKYVTVLFISSLGEISLAHIVVWVELQSGFQMIWVTDSQVWVNCSLGYVFLGCGILGYVKSGICQSGKHCSTDISGLPAYQSFYINIQFSVRYISC